MAEPYLTPIVLNRHVRKGREGSKGSRYIGRGTDWGNPFVIRPGYPRERVIELFARYAAMKLEYDPKWLEPLRGYDLLCSCAPLTCHGDVLLELLYG